jgi:hypothetical protein
VPVPPEYPALIAMTTYYLFRSSAEFQGVSNFFIRKSDRQTHNSRLLFPISKKPSTPLSLNRDVDILLAQECVTCSKEVVRAEEHKGALIKTCFEFLRFIKTFHPSLFLFTVSPLNLLNNVLRSLHTSV